MATKKTTTKATEQSPLDKAREARKRNKVDPNESKADKFIRLANLRVNKVCKALEQISKLGASQYQSTDLQRQRIVTVLREAVEETAILLEHKKSDKKERFQL